MLAVLLHAASAAPRTAADFCAAGASGNAELARQLVRHFRSPASWDDLVWRTQLLQALTVTTGIEHWRRSARRTRGSLCWQPNDCWPAPSWPSVDYAGRWKARHHAVRRAFAPVLLSAIEDAAAFTVDVHVTNDTLDGVYGAGGVDCRAHRWRGARLRCGASDRQGTVGPARLTVDAAASASARGTCSCAIRGSASMPR